MFERSWKENIIDKLALIETQSLSLIADEMVNKSTETGMISSKGYITGLSIVLIDFKDFLRCCENVGKVTMEQRDFRAWKNELS